MRKLFAILLMMMTVLPVAADKDTYSSLWKKVEEAGRKDLPRTQYEVLQQIVAKAQRENKYGQLLKAELKGASVMASIAPDSLLPAVERIEDRYQQMKDETLKTVYVAVLNRISRENKALERQEIPFELSPELCAKLAAVKAAAYEPFIQEGIDSKIFNDDLLSVIAYETRCFQPAADYYLQHANRRAACLMALEACREAHQHLDVDDRAQRKKIYLHALDSLLTVYGDLDVAGEVAIEQYEQSSFENSLDRINAVRKIIARWGHQWKRIDQLRNEERQLTLPTFNLVIAQKLMRPERRQMVRLEGLRNLSSVTLKVYRANVKGDNTLNPSVERDFNQLKPSLQLMPELTQTRSFLGHRDDEVFADSIELAPLPRGVYLIEASSVPGTQVCRAFYYVSDMFVMSQMLPERQVRFIVVSSTTGQPIPGATVRLKIRKSANNQEPMVVRLTTDKQGEALYSYSLWRPNKVYAYTNEDTACPEYYLSGNFTYYDNQQRVEHAVLYTDRQIYRPGQTVHMSAIVYATTAGYEHQVVAGKEVKASLYNANNELVKEETLKTDEYGACATDFVLPSSGLNGSYSIRAANTRLTFKVEEYKRPQFLVEFPQVTQSYQKGDTLSVTAHARSYDGMPIEGAKVRYQVVRRRAFWWYSYLSSWYSYPMQHMEDKVLAEEVTATNGEGAFEVRVPLTIPETTYTSFYQFVVTADVTDITGETHHGELVVPLGNRTTVLTCELPEKVRADQSAQVVFHQKNAAGNEMDAQLRYQWDGGKWKTVATQVPVTIPSLSSGRHTLTALCGTDTLRREFVVFSLNDRKPCIETDDWFYVSANEFPADGKPVTVQVGSSASDVHIVYSILSGNHVVEQGTMECSNTLINRQFTYQDSYENGLLLTFAWVKEGVCYRHEAKIQRALPDKQLKLQWDTFRDRLVPGQQETWTMRVSLPNGKPAEAQLLAVLYDKSLDQLAKNNLSLVPSTWVPLPSAQWMTFSLGGISRRCQLTDYKVYDVPSLLFSQFDDDAFPVYYRPYYRIRGNGKLFMAESRLGSMPKAVMAEAQTSGDVVMAKNVVQNDAVAEAAVVEDEGAAVDVSDVQVRENLQETAFFYPQLTTDKDGSVAIRFTLPESLTTWRFVGLAHTREMDYGYLEAEAIAQKPVMIKPNMPRFIRLGDELTLSAKVANMTAQTQKGVAVLQLVDPQTEKVVHEQKVSFSLAANKTEAVAFTIDGRSLEPSLLICKVVAKGTEFSDGEQHYLPVLSDKERVTVTIPFTQHEPGTKTIEIPVTPKVSDSRLTIEYTHHPAWLMVQALPAVGKPHEYNAIDQAAAYYANAVAQYLTDQNPKVKTIFDQWKAEQGSETSLMSALEKNQELKDLVLDDTPWVMNAKMERAQKNRLADFFDVNEMTMRQKTILQHLAALQLSDGGFCWWKGMPSSMYMTVAVSEMLVRLNTMTGKDEATAEMLQQAFQFMGEEMVRLTDRMKKLEKEGHRQTFPGSQALHWLYLCKLDGRTLPARVQAANTYLIRLLKKEQNTQTIYNKALSAIILQNKSYVQSLKEFTVYREEMGRYYDTPRAGYSWCDYRIPTQVAAIEAMQQLTPEDSQTISEMQRWLLQEKRTQAWDTPINSVNAVYAFLRGNQQALATGDAPSILAVDGHPIDQSAATAGIGYVKTSMPADQVKTFTAEKTSEGTSWGALYLQYMQNTNEVVAQGSEITVTRELVVPENGLQVGDRVKVRITIVAARDLDFVQVVDKRAACMEPVQPLSGYRQGVYYSPKDYTTHYYMDGLAKGKHVLETEYYIDRQGTYETGTCTVQCAYAPEFRAVCPSEKIVVK